MLSLPSFALALLGLSLLGPTPSARLTTIPISTICGFETTHCVQMPPKEKLQPPVGTVEIDKPGEFIGADLNPAKVIVAYPYRSSGTVRFLCVGDTQMQEWRLYFSTVYAGSAVKAASDNPAKGRGEVTFVEVAGARDPPAGTAIFSSTRGVNVMFSCKDD
ncbi:hypothetical protein BDZ90DRAFT_260916 [Jaminaea rosea]|uniref:Secreted protein n=1 Tax=Jaminaea rosea TaxID=1569628 RepID=A0A316UPN3_9BASI|nr:hypothetical protein BDZ90DRAFT_260916 [Jaminaea rosea]PWN27262.1 hypothetical protein BDZ90DRAFT_260916 [Jaminaea rosea]